jgi:hypothetical protein
VGPTDKPYDNMRSPGYSRPPSLLAIKSAGDQNWVDPSKLRHDPATLLDVPTHDLRIDDHNRSAEAGDESNGYPDDATWEEVMD